MHDSRQHHEAAGEPLVLGATGKNGRRLAARLVDLDDLAEVASAAPEEFPAGARGAGATPDEIDLLGYLLGTLLDGRNASPGDGVRRAVGRAPKESAAFARQHARIGIWRNVA